MKSHDDKFRVAPGAKIKLTAIDASFDGGLVYKAAKDRTKCNLERLNKLQGLLYAEHKRALLICLQAIDAGGKDGLISHVMGAMNPQGCRVTSFKEPSTLERDHDFMWRAMRELPRKGEVAVFNRSYYEEVLIERVHQIEPKSIIAQRYGQINNMEQYLVENGTHILKFYLHIDKDEQLSRFKDRLSDPAKNWKIAESDYTERAHWDDYMEDFETMLLRCSTKYAPWFIIPANHKWFRDLAVSEILVHYLESLNMQFPKPSVDLNSIRKQFHTEK